MTSAWNIDAEVSVDQDVRIKAKRAARAINLVVVASDVAMKIVSDGAPSVSIDERFNFLR